MHELGILSAMLKSIEQIAAEEKLTQFDKIVLQVGQLSGIVPSYLEECYPAAVYKTPFEGMRMELEIIPGIVRCRDCGAEFDAVEYDLKCPECASGSLEPVSGTEFIIKELHAC